MFIAHRRPWWASYLVFRPGTPVLSVQGRAQARAHPTSSSGGLWFITCCFWHDGSILCSTALSSHSALEDISMASWGTICISAVFFPEVGRNHLKVQKVQRFSLGIYSLKIQNSGPGQNACFRHTKLQAYAKDNFSVLTRKLSKEQIAKN